MKIIILGTGGVGGYYGGLLARHGQEVTFIARGTHLEAIRRNGLQVRSVHGDFHIHPARAMDATEAAGLADLILICTKSFATESAVGSALPCIGPDTIVLSLQNGIDAVERIGALVGQEHMLGGATWLSSSIEAPGIIRQVSSFHRVVVGELNGSNSPRLQRVIEAFTPTGVTIEASDDIHRILWTKFVFIAAVSGFGALTRLEIGEYRNVPQTRRQLTSLMQEVEAVGRAAGAALDVDVVDKTLAFIDSLNPGIKASMQRDVETGNRFELEAIIGVIGRKGRAHNVSTPIADMIYAGLLPMALKADGEKVISTGR